jgi:hypothetical protein
MLRKYISVILNIFLFILEHLLRLVFGKFNTIYSFIPSLQSRNFPFIVPRCCCRSIFSTGLL